MDLQRLIDRHTSGLGGANVLAGLRSMHLQGHMAESKFTIDHFNVYRLKPHFQKVWFPFGESEFAEGYDGNMAWEKQVGAESARPVTGEAANGLRRGMQLPGPMNPLGDLVARGHRLEYVRDEIIDGLRYHVLAVTLLDGFQKVYYMDSSSGLLVRSRSKQALHPSLDPAESHIETLRGDFQPVEGLMMSFREVQRDWMTGEQLSELVWHGITLNSGLQPGDFTIP